MNLLVWGKKGRMGQLIMENARNDSFWTEVIGIDVEDDPDTLPQTVDVVIDFSHPSALNPLLDFCQHHQCPLVIGTTGYDEGQLNRIQQASHHIPLVHATNMSLGMNLLFTLVEEAAAALGNDTDVEVIEAHHNRKKDAPSGSAKTIVEAIETGVGETRKKVYGRVGEMKREKGEIGIHSLRGGNIVGRHEASFIHDLESVTLTHEAYDRSVFARGALSAARFALQSQPGLYRMKDVLGLNR